MLGSPQEGPISVLAFQLPFPRVLSQELCVALLRSGATESSTDLHNDARDDAINVKWAVVLSGSLCVPLFTDTHIAAVECSNEQILVQCLLTALHTSTLGRCSKASFAQSCA